MDIVSAKYTKDRNDDNVSVLVTTSDSVIGVPLDPDNRHYAEIMRQVEAGELTIADAE